MLIYKLTCSVSGKAYIGLTTQRKGRRWYDHCWAAFSGKGFDGAIHRAIRKYGKEAFRVEILCECYSDMELAVCERALIAEHGTLAPNGYNLTIGGEIGSRVCQETRARMREAQKNKPPPTAAQRAQISAALKANPEVMAQVRELAAENHKRAKGRKKSAEERAKGVAIRRASLSATRKLTTESVAIIRSELLARVSGAALARRFGVGRSAINGIKHNRIWRDVRSEISAQVAAIPNTNIKLTAAKVIEIRKSLLAGESGPALAAQYGITVNTVSAIRTGVSWHDIAPEILAELKRRGDPQLKLSEGDVAEIKIELMLGERVPDLGRRFRVDPETIRDIKAGRSWRNVVPLGLSDFLLPMGA